MSARPARVAPTVPPRRTELRVVKRRSRRLIRRSGSTRATPLVIAGVIVAIAAIFGILLEQVLMAQSAFKLGKIRERMVAAEARHEDLVFEVSQLESDARIENYARTQLGMVDADPASVQFIAADIKARGPSRIAGSDELGPLSRVGRATGVNSEIAP